MKNKLREVPADSILFQSNKITETLVELPQYKKSRAVSVFLNMPGEISTKQIVEDILQSGRACFVPCCNNNEMRMVRLHSLKDYEELPLNSWGIPEPVDDRQDCFEFGGLDLIIMPGLAFDVNRNRIGVNF